MRPGDGETFEEHDLDSFPKNIREAYEGATPVTYSLEDLGQEWAAAYYDADYALECVEARQLDLVAGYPSLGHKTFAQAFAAAVGRNGLSLSHLCHNRRCIARSHLVLEPLPVNQGRGACAGGRMCMHPTRCLRPGRFSHGFVADEDALA